MRWVSDCSFAENQRRIECTALDEARLLQNEVNDFNQYPWKNGLTVLWFTAEVNNLIKLLFKNY